MKSATHEVYNERLNKAIAFIENNLDQKINLKDIAQEAFLSEFHFHRIFKSFTGETVKEFLLRIKLEKAANQLQNSNDNIVQIAFANGYENHESFTRAFKAYFQISPQEFRLHQQKIINKKRRSFEERKVNLSSLNLDTPVIKEIPDLHLAYLRHNGSYDKVAGSFQKLMFWAARNLVLKLKPTTLGIVHDNPELTKEENIRFDACVQLSKPIKPKGEIGYKIIPGGKFAVFRYKGPYDGFMEVYDYIYHVCIFEKQWEIDHKPALEWYIKSPPFYQPHDYVTDFCVPIK